MSVEFEKNPPEWKASGTEPPDTLKNSGFVAGYKPPAEYFNWFWNRTSSCLKELQEKVKNAVVHTTGNQTVGGVKTFTDEILAQHSITNAKTKSSADEFQSAMIFRDKQGQAFGHLQSASYGDTGDILVKLSAVTGLRKETQDETTHYIGMGMRMDGTPYTTAPTPPASDDSTQIATTEWVQDTISTNDGNVVHKTGNESIAGTKTFTGAIKAGVDALVSHADDASVVRVDGGSGWDKGASLLLYGKDETSYNGQFKIRVHDGTNYKELIGKPDGTLTWAGKKVATFNSSGHLVLPDGSEFWIA